MPERRSRNAASRSSCRLTRREREIAVQVARGLSNQEVADVLVVARRTVEWHVANLLEKLGLRARTQLARWLADHGGFDLYDDAVRGGRR
jgi:DNA-binding NarL/FixJ family response regulator